MNEMPRRANGTPQNQPQQTGDASIIFSSLMGEQVVVTYEGLDGKVIEVTGQMDALVPPYFVIITPLDQKREYIAFGGLRRIKETRPPNIMGPS
jgi:hypothetical protein